ncbi:MAG TPA: DUF72 domain-containing protein [Dongiaceae bacterium]|nr:DUF72 domain-containing protein [Dongiaceae bacterium]
MPAKMTSRGAAGRILVGVGGWTFEPWRESFYPAGLAQKRELEYASRQLTSIEINGTYYGSQKPESFARWREETPDGFVFSVKGTRFSTNRRVLAESGPSVERFLTSGVLELKEKLGPINWQFLPTKRYDPDDFEAFLKLLPASVEGHAIRHVVEVRHESFRVPGFVDLLRSYGVGVVLTDKAEFPQIADVTASFVYARLQRAMEGEKTGYPLAELDRWAKRAQAWSKGGMADGLAPVGGPEKKAAKSRDVFIYMINGFKPKAPAAAMALIARLSA